MSSYDDADECDSNYLHRLRKTSIQIHPCVEATKICDENIDEPLNLSIKSSISTLNSNLIQENDQTATLKSPIPSTVDYKNKKIDIDTNAPLDLSQNKYKFHITKQFDYSSEDDLIEEEEDDDVINQSNFADTTYSDDMNKSLDSDDNDLTDLSWLINYNISKDLKLANLCGSDDSDAEEEINKEIKKSLDQLLNPSILYSSLMIHTKPPYSFSCIIFMAIESSVRKCLSVKEIYTWILNNFPYYRSVPSGSWKNSIRHNLSYNKCFKKIDKNQLTSRDFSGKGSLWSVNSAYRLNLMDTLKRMPNNIQKMFEDVPESAYVYQTCKIDAVNAKVFKCSPKITNVARQNKAKKPNKDDLKLKLTDFYKKACFESLNECSDVDAANALLLIKSSSESTKHFTNTNNENNKKSQPNEQATTSIIRKRKLSATKTANTNKKKLVETTPYPNDDHTYSYLLRKQQLLQQQQQNSSLQIKVKSDDEDDDDENDLSDLNEDFSTDSEFDFAESDENSHSTCSTRKSISSDVSFDRMSNTSATTIRNALLELSRAAELIEDKKNKEEKADEEDIETNEKTERCVEKEELSKSQ